MASGLSIKKSEQSFPCRFDAVLSLLLLFESELRFLSCDSDGRREGEGQCSKGAGDRSPVQVRLWHQSTILGKAKRDIQEKRQEKSLMMSGDHILKTFLLFMIRGVIGPVIVTDKQWLCHYCSMGKCEWHHETINMCLTNLNRY